MIFKGHVEDDLHPLHLRLNSSSPVALQSIRASKNVCHAYLGHLNIYTMQSLLPCVPIMN